MKKFCTGVARKPFFIRGARRKDFSSVNPAIFSKLDIQAR